MKTNAKALLQINSSGRFEGSITRQLSDLVVEQIMTQQGALEIIDRDLSSGMPFVDQQWIEANFTAPEQRSATHKETLKFSDELVDEMIRAETIVIASPIYNFSIPAVLKAWVDMIARVHRTFRYTENGPVGLLKNKKVLIAMSSGGVPIGSNMEFASHYLKQVLGFVGISDVTIIDASKINLSGDDKIMSAEKQVDALL